MPTAKKSTKSPTKKATSQSASQQPPVAPAQTPKKLTKSATDKVFFGVAAGIAEYLSIDPVLIRLLFVILAISGGSGVLIYLVLGLIVPEAASTATSTKEVITENGKNLEKTIETTAANIESMAKQRKSQTWIGFGIVVIGMMLMANNVGLFALHDIARFVSIIGWPLALIVLGLIILNKNKND